MMTRSIHLHFHCLFGPFVTNLNWLHTGMNVHDQSTSWLTTYFHSCFCSEFLKAAQGCHISLICKNSRRAGVGGRRPDGAESRGLEGTDSRNETQCKRSQGGHPRTGELHGEKQNFIWKTTSALHQKKTHQPSELTRAMHFNDVGTTWTQGRKNGVYYMIWQRITLQASTSCTSQQVRLKCMCWISSGPSQRCHWVLECKAHSRSFVLWGETLLRSNSVLNYVSYIVLQQWLLLSHMEDISVLTLATPRKNYYREGPETWEEVMGSDLDDVWTVRYVCVVDLSNPNSRKKTDSFYQATAICIARQDIPINHPQNSFTLLTLSEHVCLTNNIYWAQWKWSFHILNKKKIWKVLSYFVVTQFMYWHRHPSAKVTILYSCWEQKFGQKTFLSPYIPVWCMCWWWEDSLSSV